MRTVYRSLRRFAKYFLTVLISVSAILGSSMASLYLSKLVAGRRYHTDAGIGLTHRYENSDLAFIVGFLGYIIILPTILFLIKQRLNSENEIPYQIGTFLGIPYVLFHILLLVLNYGG